MLDPAAGLKPEIISTIKDLDSIAKYRKRRERRHKVKSTGILSLVTPKVPNMSRRVQGSAMCAFPTFDRCDSLVFMPITMVKCFNNHDFESLNKLFRAHAHKNCTVHFKGQQFNVRGFLAAMEVLSLLHPDKMSCCHGTTVKDNEIHASVLCKFTENKTVYESVAESGRTQFPGLFPFVERAARWRHQLRSAGPTIPVQQQELIVSTVAASNVDLEVYGCLNYTFRFDFATRKVVRLDYDMVFTEVRIRSGAVVPDS